MQYLVPGGIVIALVLIGVVVFWKRKTAPAKKKADPRHLFPHNF